MDAYSSPEDRMRADGAEVPDFKARAEARRRQQRRQDLGNAASAACGRFKAKTLAECQVDHAANYIIKGVLARRNFALIYSQPGAGKSLLGPLLAHAAANGRQVFGHRTRASRVLYIAAEAPEDMEVRFAAMRKRFGEAANLHLLALPIDLQDRIPMT